jgi:meiotically up-regulated gene 157 (Mug157) protein
LSLVNRRDVLRGGLGSLVVAGTGLGQVGSQVAPFKGRPAVGARRFTSEGVERAIAETLPHLADKELARMFAQCFPNTLDTTVYASSVGGVPDTYVVTGDIDAMWLRDSSAQVSAYLPFAKSDAKLRSMLEGVVRRHAALVLRDPYANSFTKNVTDKPLSWSVHDRTKMLPGVAERKWEVDSLCYVLRLAHGFWKATGDVAAFDGTWHQAAALIVKTFREQQRKTGKGPYSFQREAAAPTDTLPLGGYGNPARSVGLLYSMFRPSDDACIYPFLIPSNLFAVAQLKNLAEIVRAVYKDEALAAEADALRGEVSSALEKYGTVVHPEFGKIWAFEVDGYGNALMMDDANAPGLMSLAYLGCCDRSDPLYQATRRFCLSEANPYFFKGTAAEGIGGPHIGLGYIWPMALLVRALTADNDAEIAACLAQLRDTTAGTGFMHESFNKDRPADFTRAWFGWANTLFGELILKLKAERPGLLATVLPAWRARG